MTWKAIGHSITGTSHLAAGRGCEDVVKYQVYQHGDKEVMACAVCDGAGSAAHAAFAANYIADRVLKFASDAQRVQHVMGDHTGDLYALAEEIYEGLSKEAAANKTTLDEYSCTLLGCIVTEEMTLLFQVGDGAIVQGDDNGHYTPVWWPQSGEYHNTTSFFVDDPNFGTLRTLWVPGTLKEIAIFTDGLQMLALNWENQSVHQPFFTGLFHHLRMADSAEKLALLDQKLATYLDSPAINERTDDDKTLFLATRRTP